ncbi:MAG: RNA 2',3'-cyclic phosphodiesterase [Candidatus Omnitrophota bacterium]
MPSKIRAFIAIELESKVKDKISQIQNILQKTNADAKWVNPKNIHLTLKFLGYIDQEKSEKIKQVIDQTAENFQSFSIETSQIGIFPQKGTPRVIWIGIKKGKETLEKITSKIEEKIEKLGIKKENRPFQSHATIARIRSPKNKQILLTEIKRINEAIDTEIQTISAIALFRSTLSPSGPTYSLIHKAKLQ